MQKSFVPVSVLAEGNWFKIATTSDAVYKLTYSDLMASGALPPFKAVDFRLFGNGGSMLPEKNSVPRFDDLIENSVLVIDGGDGYIDLNDYILFYGVGTSGWIFNPGAQTFHHQINYYSDSTFYYFTFDRGPGKRILPYPSISAVPDITVNSYNHLVFHELDSVNLLKSGKQWLGEVFNDPSPRFFNFILSDLSDTAETVADISLMARSVQATAFQVNVNGISSPVSILPVDGNLNSEYAKMGSVHLGFIPNSDTIKIQIAYDQPESSSLGWLNYIELAAVRKLVYRQEQIKFRNIQTIGNNISQFNIDNSGNVFQVWHLADSGNISQMQLITNGNSSTFKANSASLSEFIAFDQNNAGHVALLGPVPNQNLHGLPQAEFVIVTHPLFLAQANQLADFHRNYDLLSAAVATTQQIYNEFSSGKQDPAAIRDFVRMFYERGENDTLHRVQYLLLFGDGSYDMKHRIPQNTNLIPTWQTANSVLPISSYVSDDFFGMLDSLEGDELYGDIDVGVGRFPVSTSAEADILVAKSMRYGIPQDLMENAYENGLVSNFDSWRNKICFIADDEDGNLHFNQTEKMVNMLDSITHNLNVNKIYLDAYNQVHTPSGDRYPDVNTDIDKNIKNGSLLINYVGHGGEYGLASESILTFSEIGKYNNFLNLPVFVTATCEFSRYDNPELVSAGEKILLHPNGGGIAMFSTTRIAFAHSNEIVNRNLLKTAFTPNHTDKVRFGDIIKASKNLCGNGVYKENFTLLGDPALSLAIPQYNIVTEKIMSDTIDISGDTIFNSRVITVKGFIADRNGYKQDWFNGKLYPSVYDKPITIATLANDNSQSYIAPFQLQQNLLYQGNSTVKDGEFSFSFFAPSDITFGDGFGKIIYYAKSPFFDAHGVSDSLLLKNNGFSNVPDILGPDIDLFMEELTFKDSGETSVNPVLYAFLHDTSGINAYGIGIGHEIIAELDDGFNAPYFLNPYFIQEADRYTSGKITYRFYGLSYGLHKLKLSASDLLNNKGGSEIYFNVKSPSDIELGGIYNYPDPVWDHTTFYIQRNMSTDIMFLKISILDITGKLCAEINRDILPDTYKPIQIFWDATNANGQPLSKGFYTYTVTLSDENGKIRQKADKMVIIK